MSVTHSGLHDLSDFTTTGLEDGLHIFEGLLSLRLCAALYLSAGKG